MRREACVGALSIFDVHLEHLGYLERVVEHVDDPPALGVDVGEVDAVAAVLRAAALAAGDLAVPATTSKGKERKGRKERKGERRGKRKERERKEKGMACVMHVCQRIQRRARKDKGRQGEGEEGKEGKRVRVRVCVCACVCACCVREVLCVRALSFAWTYPSGLREKSPSSFIQSSSHLPHAACCLHPNSSGVWLSTQSSWIHSLPWELGKGREGKREGKGNGMGREGKGREGKGRVTERNGMRVSKC